LLQAKTRRRGRFSLETLAQKAGSAPGCSARSSAAWATDGRVIELLGPRPDLPVVKWATVHPKGFDGRERPITIGAETSLLLARDTLVVPDVNGREWTIASGDTVRLEAESQFCPVNRGDGAAETVETSTDSPL